MIKPQQSALANLGGTTQALRRVQQAATGRSTQATGAIQEDVIPEQVALQEAEQMQRIQTAQEQQAIAGIQQKEQAQRQELKFGLQDMEERETNAIQEMLNKTSAILQDFEQGKARLDNARDKSRMEQALFGMRLANKKYTDQLEIEGRKRRLDNAVQFKEALTEAMFKEEMNLLKDDLSFRRKMAADEREFEKMLAEVDLELAIKLALQEAEAVQIAQMTTGAKAVVSGSIEGYEAYNKAQGTQNGTQSTQATGTGTAGTGGGSK
jgi:hypothetical protein